MCAAEKAHCVCVVSEAFTDVAVTAAAAGGASGTKGGGEKSWE
jgi:hypothetical protein